MVYKFNTNGKTYRVQTQAREIAIDAAGSLSICNPYPKWERAAIIDDKPFYLTGDIKDEADRIAFFTTGIEEMPDAMFDFFLHKVEALPEISEEGLFNVISLLSEQNKSY